MLLQMLQLIYLEHELNCIWTKNDLGDRFIRKSPTLWAENPMNVLHFRALNIIAFRYFV